MERKKLDIKQTSWDLSPLFSGDNDPKMGEKREEYKRTYYAFINKWKERTDYLEDPSVLKGSLDELESLIRNFSFDEIHYFHLRSAQDSDNTVLKARMNQAKEFAIKISNDCLFFSLKLSKIPVAKQEEFLEAECLKEYKHYLESLFISGKHALSEAEERIIKLKEGPAHDEWEAMTACFIDREEREVLDEDGRPAIKNFSEILAMLNSQCKLVRDSSAVALNSIFAKHIDVAEREMNAILLNKKIDDELCHYSRPDQSRHEGDDIDSDVVDLAVKLISERFDIAQRYYQLRAKLLGLPIMAYHERNIPYGSVSKKYGYEESAELVYKVFGRLDPEFGLIVKKFFENGQVDALPQKGKDSGAFCSSGSLNQPNYILLNHNDELYAAVVMAHECGHGVNHELIKKTQNALNDDSPTSTAEVASTFMEDFVLREILEKADDELRLTLLMQKLNNDISTIFRQIAFYKFEQELHDDFRKEGYLSKDDIGKLFQKHMEAYMGPAVEQSPGSENWWCYVSHFRYFFYVYSYATGLLISKSLQAAVKNDPEFIIKVKGFLSAGSSDSPKNLFLKLGIDITDAGFWKRGLQEVEDLLIETEALAKKLGKI